MQRHACAGEADPARRRRERTAVCPQTARRRRATAATPGVCGRSLPRPRSEELDVAELQLPVREVGCHLPIRDRAPRQIRPLARQAHVASRDVGAAEPDDVVGADSSERPRARARAPQLRRRPARSRRTTRLPLPRRALGLGRPPRRSIGSSSESDCAVRERGEPVPPAQVVRGAPRAQPARRCEPGQQAVDGVAGEDVERGIAGGARLRPPVGGDAGSQHARDAAGPEGRTAAGSRPTSCQPILR